MCKGPQASAALMDQMNRYSVGGLIDTTSSMAENPHEDLDRIDAALRGREADSSSRLELATTQPRRRGYDVDHVGYAYNLPVTVDGLSGTSTRLVDPEDKEISLLDLLRMISAERDRQFLNALAPEYHVLIGANTTTGEHKQQLVVRPSGRVGSGPGGDSAGLRSWLNQPKKAAFNLVFHVDGHASLAHFVIFPRRPQHAPGVATKFPITLVFFDSIGDNQFLKERYDKIGHWFRTSLFPETSEYHLRPRGEDDQSVVVYNSRHPTFSVYHILDQGDGNRTSGCGFYSLRTAKLLTEDYPSWQVAVQAADRMAAAQGSSFRPALLALPYHDAAIRFQFALFSLLLYRFGLCNASFLNRENERGRHLSVAHKIFCKHTADALLAQLRALRDAERAPQIASEINKLRREGVLSANEEVLVVDTEGGMAPEKQLAEAWFANGLCDAAGKRNMEKTIRGFMEESLGFRRLE